MIKRGLVNDLPTAGRALVRSMVLIAAAAVAMVSGGSVFAAEPLTVFEWSGYEDPEFHKSYTEKYGGSPKYAFYVEEEEGFQKLRAGYRADIAHPCTLSTKKWKDAGLIKPIDTSRIKAWDNVIPELRKIDGVEIDGKVYMVPVDWGNTAVIYRTDQVKLDNKSIKFLTDPAYKGRISIPDGVDDVYAMAALLAGIKDHLNMTDAQFKAATDALRAVAKNVRFYWSDATQLNQALAAGEVVAALAWNESLLNLKGEGVPVEMMFDAKEGVSTWVCGFVLLNDAPGSEDHAYDYINAFMEAQSGKYMIEAWGYGHANGEAFSAASKESLETLGFGDFRAFIKNSLFQGAINPALKEKMIAEFEKIKAGF